MKRRALLALTAGLLALPLACPVDEDPARDVGAMERAVERTEGQRPPGPVDGEVRQFGETEEEAEALRRQLNRRYRALVDRWRAIREAEEVSPETTMEVERAFSEAERQLEEINRSPAEVFEQTREELDEALDEAEYELNAIARQRA